MVICRFMQKGSQRHNDKGRANTSFFIVRVRKGLLRVLLWEGVGDRTELQYIHPHSYGRQRCVFIVLQGCSTGCPGAQLSAGRWLSLLHLITNWSPKLHRGSRGPLRPDVAFPSTTCLRRLWSPTGWLPVLTELCNISTSTQSPTQSFEWHVWSLSSGNNCHAVQKSLFSGASVYVSIMGFLPCPISSVNFRLRDFFRLLAVGMSHFLPVHHFGMACLAGSKVKIQQWFIWGQDQVFAILVDC